MCGFDGRLYMRINYVRQCAKLMLFAVITRVRLHDEKQQFFFFIASYLNNRYECASCLFRRFAQFQYEIDNSQVTPKSSYIATFYSLPIAWFYFIHNETKSPMDSISRKLTVNTLLTLRLELEQVVQIHVASNQ